MDQTLQCFLSPTTKLESRYIVFQISESEAQKTQILCSISPIQEVGYQELCPAPFELSIAHLWTMFYRITAKNNSKKSNPFCLGCIYQYLLMSVKNRRMYFFLPDLKICLYYRSTNGDRLNLQLQHGKVWFGWKQNIPGPPVTEEGRKQELRVFLRNLSVAREYHFQEAPETPPEVRQKANGMSPGLFLVFEEKKQ